MTSFDGEGAAAKTQPESGVADSAPDQGNTTSANHKRTRKTRPFPSTSFGEALFLANAIQEHGSGQKIRRLTLFEALGRAPDSGPSRKLITSSGQYGITIIGSYNAEYFELTPVGLSRPMIMKTLLRASWRSSICR